MDVKSTFLCVVGFWPFVLCPFETLLFVGCALLICDVDWRLWIICYNVVVVQFGDL